MTDRACIRSSSTGDRVTASYIHRAALRSRESADPRAALAPACSEHEMNLFKSAAARRMAVLIVCTRALAILPGRSVWATARAIGTRTLALVGRAVRPASRLGAALSPSPTVTASMSAPPAVHLVSAGKARP